MNTKNPQLGAPQMIEYYHHLFEKYHDILLLETPELSYEIIEFELGEKDHVTWNEEKKCWIIMYDVLTSEFYIIHELGHIVFYLKTGYKYFAKLAIKTFKRIIFFIFNGLMDSWANSWVCIDNRIYSIFVERCRSLIPNKFKEGDLSEALALYINLYLDYNFILKDKDKLELEGSFREIFKNLKDLIMEKSTNTPIEIKESFFPIFNEILNDFGDIKLTTKPQVVINFIFMVSQGLKLEESRVLKQLELMFPNLAPL